MKPERLPDWEALGKGMEIVFSNASAEMIVLKMHLMTEAHLYRLLSFRLEMEERHLPALQFFPLAKLALGGEAFKSTLVKVLALNDLRNEFSHELDESRLEPAFATFCRKLSVFWPPFDVAKNPSGFAELRRGAVGVGASICVREVWQEFARLVAAKQRAIGDDPIQLLHIIGDSERTVAQLLAQHNAVRAKWEPAT